jgi:flagellum-specific peptidoglycan hydrolase FlgJ
MIRNSIRVIFIVLVYILGMGTNAIYIYSKNLQENSKNQKLIIESRDSTLVGTVNLHNDLDTIISLAKLRDSVQAEYIEKYVYIAINENTKYNFPASVKIAQFLLEGGFNINNPNGSKLVIENNNPFGIRYFGDDIPNRILNWNNYALSKDIIKLYSTCANKSCRYIKFKSIWHSFRYHSLFMVGTEDNPSHYMKYVSDDSSWSNWIDALDKGGYATSDAYKSSLRSIIIKYRLYLLDKYEIIL